MWANAWDVFHHTPSQGVRGRPVVVDFVVFLGAAGFRVYFVGVFPLNERGLLKYEAALPHLPLY